MPEVKLSIGGRDFVVACQEGEEPHLEQAAALLDAEAETIRKQLGRVPEGRMLLMAGLMLADRTIEIAKKMQDAEHSIERLTRALQSEQGGASDEDLAAARKTAEQAVKLLEQTVARVEKLADSVSGG